MPSGAVHPNSGNFSRGSKFNIVERIRKLVNQNAYEKRPQWLEFVERAPPMELHNLKLRDIRVRSPYPSMVRFVLQEFPDMRFQDCFVDGNDWSKGNDRYRDDHPVMQFVARQLQLMNEEGLTRPEAFEKTRCEYLDRRRLIENQAKVDMAIACNQRIVPAFNSPLFTTAAGVARSREAELEIAHLNHIRRKLRMLRKEIEPHDRRRMSAKEIALDMEVERTSLLPRMSGSVWKSAKDVDVNRDVTAVNEESINEDHFEFITESENEEEEPVFEWKTESIVMEPSNARERSGRKSNPVDLGLIQSESELIESKMVWEPKPTVPKAPGPTFLNDKPVHPVSKPIPAFAHSRPDKATVQAVLARKAKSELERRIGKEPGYNDGDLDFEDFMNMIQKKK
jgi:hypothetical protein